jgi:hypothetical protein
VGILMVYRSLLVRISLETDERWTYSEIPSALNAFLYALAWSSMAFWS